MDVETLSNLILDDYRVDNFSQDDSDSLDNFLEHHGVKGMKWGVRKDRKSSGKKKTSSTTKSNEKLRSILLGKNRKYKDETTAQYQARMKRESNERIAKINAQQQAASEKRTLKSQEKIAKMQIKAAEKERAEEAARNNPKTNVSNKKSPKEMSDQEIRDAIARFKLEQDYKSEQKKARSATYSIKKKTLITAATIAGGVLLTVGKQVATKQLSDIGNQQLDKKFVEKGWKLYSTGKSEKKKKGDGD